MCQKKAIVYVDGLNLYYGLLKKTPYKWLDLYKFASLFLVHRGIEIVEIKYFCAKIPSDSYDPYSYLRQKSYLIALESFISKYCHYTCIEGYFKTGVVKRGLLMPQKKDLVEIITNEEKGTDVNIGVHIIHDMHTRDDYNVICLISNDSDLVEPLRLARMTNKEVSLILPIKKYTQLEIKEITLIGGYIPRPSGKLIKYADWYTKRGVTKEKLRICQLPNPSNGIQKPATR